ncbi:MAG: response regulator [Elusimicrobiota bacterium]
MKILIVDDSHAANILLMRKFEKEGYEVVTALTGEEGVSQAGLERPDVVVMDTVLPGINGFEACRRIKEARGREAPWIVIVTGFVDALDPEKAAEAGADGYCAKTMGLDPLVETVGKVVGSAKAG